MISYECDCGMKIKGDTFESVQEEYNYHRKICKEKPGPKDMRCLGCTMGPPMGHSPMCKTKEVNK